jgi:putative thioredoxin
VLTDTDASLNAMKNITFGHPRFDTVTAIRTMAETLKAKPAGHEATDALLLKSQEALRNKNVDAALTSLIELIIINKNFQDELPRRAVVALFHLLGPQHELTKKYQRRFSMALY